MLLLLHHEEYKLNVRFTKDSWNGRMKACGGVGASLTKEEIASWEKEHKALLDNIALNEFEIALPSVEEQSYFNVRCLKYSMDSYIIKEI